jgi:hypothetical protein
MNEDGYEGFNERISGPPASIVCNSLDKAKEMAAETNSPMAVYKRVGRNDNHYTIPLEWAPRWGSSTTIRSGAYVWYRVDPDGKVTEI